MSEMERDLILILPQIMVLLTAVAALAAEMFGKRKASLGCVIAGMAAATAISISNLHIHATTFSGTFRIDLPGRWSGTILCPSAVLFCLLARQELKDTPREGTVYSLLCFATLGSLLLAGSGDLMFIVLGLLMNGLSGFALAAYAKTDAGTEGAMKYFIYGTVTTAIMIFGLSYWAGMTGDTLLSSLGEKRLPPLVLAFGFVALITGLGYAASLFPFHFWTPDTFEGAPVSIAAYLSIVPKIGAFFGLAQVCRSLPLDTVNWPMALAVLAALSMTFGNILALLQNKLIRLMAYSTIAQAGYFLLGVIGVQAGVTGIHALIVFGAAYAAMNAGAFAVILNIGKTLEDFRGIGTRKIFTGIAMTFFLLSLVGIPPLAGFAGKLLLFNTAMQAGYTWLAVVAIINSVISLTVYIRIIAVMYFSDKGERQEQAASPVPGHTVVVACFLITVVLTFVLQYFF